jgi:ATP:corrinoid adenosyltransferase
MLLNQQPKNLIYFDSNFETISNIAIGNLIRAIGNGKSIAYVNSDKTVKFNNFLENLSLSYNFKKEFSMFQLDIFNFDKKKITKSLLPQVEFNSIDENFLWSQLTKYDIVIFDNFDLNKFSEFSFINHLNNKNPLQSVVLITKRKKDFTSLKQYFDEALLVKEKLQKTLLSNKNIISITGSGLGKSSYSFGHLVLNFIKKKDVKLIYFDKGNFFGEMIFFQALKKWSKQNNLYGSFDFVATGVNRFYGNNYREESINEDRKEAKEALMLLKTAIKKQSPVVADELCTVINKGLLTIQEVCDVLKSVDNELLITGENLQKEIKDLTTIIINIEKVD